jgi:hypothetical protein
VISLPPAFAATRLEEYIVVVSPRCLYLASEDAAHRFVVLFYIW